MIADINESMKNIICRVFADDTKVSVKIRKQEDTESTSTRPQYNLQSTRGMYKTKSVEVIKENKTIKDLVVLTSRFILLSEHIGDLVFFK